MYSALSLAKSLLEYAIPPPEKRRLVSSETTKFHVGSFVFLVVMGGLARREGTWTMRLALLPFALICVMRGTMGFVRTEPLTEGINHTFGTYGFLLCSKLVDYALSSKPMLKLSEEQRDGLEHGRELKKHPYGSAASAGSNGVESPTDVAPLSPPQSPWFSALAFIYDGLELLVNFRGIGWEFGSGQGLHVPIGTRNVHNRPIFVLQSLFSSFLHYLMVDLLTTIIHETPGLGTPQGGSIFAFGRNVFEKYTISTALHIITGLYIYISVGMVYEFVAAVTVMLGVDPTAWPPFVDKPWLSTSLHEFWGKRWHQVFRRPLLIIGGYPCAFILRLFGLESKTAHMFGAFILSGLFHNYHYYATSSGRTPGFPCIAFFLAQCVGFVLEREWKHRTGRNVGGWSGRLWVALWILVGAQPCIDSWHRLGFLGWWSAPPPESSPTQLITIPILRRLGVL